MTFEEALRDNIDDKVNTLDIAIHIELHNLNIRKEDTWSYSWDLMDNEELEEKVFRYAQRCLQDEC